MAKLSLRHKGLAGASGSNDVAISVLSCRRLATCVCWVAAMCCLLTQASLLLTLAVAYAALWV